MSIFTEVAVNRPAVSRFDLSHDVKLSMRMGYIVPTCVMECLPGDKFNISVQNMLRFSPLIAPVMHRVHVTTHYFFVPNRILWPNWEKWITGDLDTTVPYCEISKEVGDINIPVNSLADYMGYPGGTGLNNVDKLKVSPFPIAAYYKIYDEYFRDQNLVTEKYLELIDGDNTALQAQRFTNPPLKRAWMHDYFTSALPFAQKGDAVQIPLVTQNDIKVDYNTFTGNTPTFRRLDTNNLIGGALTSVVTAPDGGVTVNSVPVGYDPDGTLSVDVQAGATDINSLRRAFRLQEWLEKNARGGTRYIESMRMHFDVISSDARLQRPEYIGGARQNMVVSEVLNTAGSETGGPDLQPVGSMSGHGISVGGGGRIRHFCEEHGWIIGLINVQPVTAYQQGIHRQFTRFDRLDYAWPSFANLGEQEVRVKELYHENLTAAEMEEIFGYVPRYAEYKYANSRVAGQFKTTLDHWHFSRKFANKPTLSEQFIECTPRLDPFAVTDPNVDHIYAHVYNNISAVRKLPKFGIPTI